MTVVYSWFFKDLIRIFLRGEGLLAGRHASGEASQAAAASYVSYTHTHTHIPHTHTHHTNHTHITSTHKTPSIIKILRYELEQMQ